MTKPYKSPQIKCPCCQRMRNLAATPLVEQGAWLKKHHWSGVDLFKGALEGNFSWACDFCIADGIAIKPDYSKQNFGLGGPIIAYIDQKLVCRSCQKDFVFKASEQKYWYEDLGFIIDSIPVNCVDCRKNIKTAKNAHEQLGIELNNLNGKDHDQLMRIAALYDNINNKEKAELFRRRAENIFK